MLDNISDEPDCNRIQWAMRGEMSARDLFHNAVKIALKKEGWVITDDPLHIRIGGVIDMYIDLGAEKIIAAQKDGQKIAVEIKKLRRCINDF